MEKRCFFRFLTKKHKLEMQKHCVLQCFLYFQFVFFLSKPWKSLIFHRFFNVFVVFTTPNHCFCCKKTMVFANPICLFCVFCVFCLFCLFWQASGSWVGVSPESGVLGVRGVPEVPRVPGVLGVESLKFLVTLESLKSLEFLIWSPWSTRSSGSQGFTVPGQEALGKRQKRQKTQKT